MENWLSPLNKIIWMQAFRKRTERVTLRDGREFIVTYGNESFFQNEVTEYAFVVPVKGLVPRGYFRMNKVTDESWLMELSREGQPRENIYANILDLFIKSDYQGIDVLEEYPNLAGRQSSSIRQGFNHAIAERKKSKIQVMTSGGKVYLLKDDAQDADI